MLSEYSKSTYIKIAALYFIAAVIWLLLFELVIDMTITDASVRQPYFFVRGFVLAVFTAIFIFVILRRRELVHRKLEGEIVNSEEKWRTAFEEANDPIFILDKDLRILRANQIACDIYGYSELELRKMTMRNLRTDAVNENVSLNFMGVTKNTGYKFQTIHRKKDGTYFPVEVSTRASVHNNRLQYIDIVHDLSDREKMENSIRESNERLHELAAHLQSIREDERKMLAREIHDQLGQELTALKIDIALLGKKIKKGGESPEAADMLESINGMNSLTEHTINTVRRIATELRPDMLDKLGLKEAILWMAEDFEKRTGIKCSIELPEEFGFGGNLDTTIFRIIQESLTNTARHSGASTVSISAEINDVIRVFIEDDGKGVNDEEVKNTKSLGLLGIRERAYSHGGVFTIETGREKGAKFVLTIPLNKSLNKKVS